MMLTLLGVLSSYHCWLHDKPHPPLLFIKPDEQWFCDHPSATREPMYWIQFLWPRWVTDTSMEYLFTSSDRGRVQREWTETETFSEVLYRQASAIGYLVLTDTGVSSLKGLLPLQGVKGVVSAFKDHGAFHRGVVPYGFVGNSTSWLLTTAYSVAVCGL